MDNNKHQEIWSNCLKIIRDNVPSISFRTWFEPIIPLK
ncbi:MAG: DnaA N-terminal domain-containing protein, partial [Bacteroidales bacterium]|nr:DnaA N-terminal domain-containing protein [Bacteroidales bacterium]